MKKIVFFNQKGGTGKSTCTVNVAGCLDLFNNKRVLVIDNDSQMNSTHNFIADEQIDKDISHFLRKKAKYDDIIYHYSINAKTIIDTNIDLIAGSREVEEVDIKDILVYQGLMDQIEDNYDYCLFDCPPHISNLTLASLAVADYVIVPALADTDSLCGYDLLIDTVNQIRNSETNIDLKILGIVFNNVEFNKALEKYIINDCKENMGDIVFNTYIRRCSAVSQARFYGKPLCYYKKSSLVTSDFKNLTDELIEKVGE